MKPISAFALALFAPVLLATEGGAQCVTADIHPAGALAGDNVGTRVAVRGEWAVVSHPGNDTVAVDAGAVHVYRWNGTTWAYHQELVASDGEAGDRLGERLALDDGRLAVAALHENEKGDGAGAVYVFDLVGDVWGETAKLVAPDGSPGDSLGMDTALDGDRILAGARRTGAHGPSTGSAYFFRFYGSTWSLEQKVLASDGAAGDFFGVSTALSGDDALIGARFADAVALNSGAAYAFHFDGVQWVETQKLAASDGAQGDLFATAMAIDGDRALISSHFNDELGVDAGAAYAFEHVAGRWVETAKLLPLGASPGDCSSTVLALAGDLAVLGAPHNGALAPGGGAFDVFRRSGSTWTDLGRVYSPNPRPGAEFGDGIAVDGGRILAGAYQEALGAGAAYAFTLDPGECAGLSADVSSFSAAAGGAQTLFLHAGLPSGNTAYLMLGTLSGTHPGIAYAGLAIPLNPDDYFDHTVAKVGSPPLVGGFGTLDGLGAAEVQFLLGPDQLHGTVGLLLFHAFVLIDPTAPALLTYASNPVALTILP